MLLLIWRFFFVMLVPDLADQFTDVLHRHNSAGAAVFIDYNGDVRFAGVFEQQTDRFHLQRQTAAE